MSEAGRAAELASWDGRRRGYSFLRGVHGCMTSYICAERLEEACHGQCAVQKFLELTRPPSVRQLRAWFNLGLLAATASIVGKM